MNDRSLIALFIERILFLPSFPLDFMTSIIVINDLLYQFVFVLETLSGVICNMQNNVLGEQTELCK